MGVIDSVGGWLYDEAGSLKKWGTTQYYDAKAWAQRKKDEAEASKDGQTITKSFDHFIEQSEGGVSIFFNKLTGERITGAAAIKLRAEIAAAGGIPTNTTFISPGSVEPGFADTRAVYSATAPSESYKVETPGKANGGNGTDSAGTTIPGKPDVPFSLFNHWSLMNYVGGPLDTISNADYNKPLNAGQDLTDYRNPSATRIIDWAKEKNNPGYQWSFADFAMAKYYGKVSNNYMVTLRRFPMPVEDNIINPMVIGPGGETVNNGMPDIARAVTWMDETIGNKLEDILKFDVSTVWEEVKSEIQEIASGEKKGGKLGEMIGGNFFASAALGAANGMDASQIQAANSGYDATKGTYPNHVFGPINIIDKVMVRKAGLDFTGDMSLTFHYSLRQLDGVSPKIAFLDLLANMLVLTYNNGNFWGGSTRYTGGAQGMNQPFGDFSKLKSGDFGGFLGSIVGDVFGKVGNIVADIKENGIMGNKFTQNIIGGGLMDLFGTPQGGEAIKAFLTGDPTGQYHVTIGNPMAPIATIGNLYCDKADFKFGGEMSYEGFPTELTVVVSLKPARPRDKADIERMFNGGRERMYLTPEGGVNTNNSTNNSVYGNADTPHQAGIYRKMANG